MNQSTAQNQQSEQSVADSSGSYIYNKETSLHFLENSKARKGSNSQRKIYNISRLRFINLEIAEKLDKHEKREHKTIEKTVRRLRFCSKYSALENEYTGDTKILKTSKKCKSPNCSICRRNRSAKMSRRLKAAYQDEDNQYIFKNKYFYMLTLTLKHNPNLRNDNYLPELKKHSAKLRRSKLYKNLFDGSITSYENVIGESHDHIHSHSLCLGSKLTEKVKIVQSKISALWLKITGDSTNTQLQLIRANQLEKAIQEVLKYSTKITKLDELEGQKLDRFVNWIISTKSTNFVNCSGVLKPLQITSNKSKYDSYYEEPEHDDNSVFFFGRTAKNGFNYRLDRTYSKKGKEYLKENIHLKKIDKKGFFVEDEFQRNTALNLLSDFDTIDEMRSHILETDDSMNVEFEESEQQANKIFDISITDKSKYIQSH